ncbi:hypothetical protein [[Phormidium] sp. ETS-05]|uniref:hypothetical protein n=1 Tax=[Phormidium] sp. ETS-05 TaxID=222819 RepID=UPI0018EF2C0A|nr:hypothetical protein [[Phormidium] sp. ETS-05]
MKTKLLVRWLSPASDDRPHLGHHLYQGLANFSRSVLFIGLLLISLLPLTLISLLVCGDEEADGDAPEAATPQRHRSQG